MKSTKKIAFSAIFILILAFSFFIVFSIHKNHPYPLHEDEWHHITQSMKMMRGEDRGPDYEIGFHAFIAGLIYIGIDPVLSYQYFPAIFMALSLITLFLLMRKLTDTTTAMITMIFFSSIKSNVNLLGVWFFTPLTMAIPFVFLNLLLFTYLLEKEENQFLYLWLLSLIILFFIHPVSALIIIPIYMILAIPQRKFFLKWKNLLLILVLIALLLLIGKSILKIGIIELFNRFIFHLIYYKGWGVIEIMYNPITFFGIIPTIMAIIGLYHVITNNKKIFWIWPAVCFSLILVYAFSGVSLLSPYQRTFYIFIISLAPLSGIGLVFVIRKAQKGYQNKFKHKNKWLIPTAIVLMSSLIIFYSFQGYYKTIPQAQLYQTINKEDYSAMKYLSQYPRSIVIANIWKSSAIYPISGHEPIATNYFYGDETAKNDVKRFFNVSCEEKEQILIKYYARYIISETDIECPRMNLIYDKGTNVYKYN